MTIALGLLTEYASPPVYKAGWEVIYADRRRRDTVPRPERRWAYEGRCGGCGYYESEEYTFSGHEPWGCVFTPVEGALLSEARDLWGRTQERSERLAEKWPFVARSSL